MGTKHLRFILILNGLLLVLTFATANPSFAADLTKAALIPKPVSVKSGAGNFEFNGGLDIRVNEVNPGMISLAKYLDDFLTPATGSNNVILEPGVQKSEKYIQLETDDAISQLGKEGYELTISPGTIRLSAHTPEGVFRGLQTIRQLLPASFEGKKPIKGPWKIPCGTILDYPEYTYRGAMLDVARHFFGPDDVKRFIDLIAAYKMNVLHLHLADDQGWRIEIKSWPSLTKIGGTTQVGGGKGGFYTQEVYKEIVQYAADRFITIIPEIDMPGHTNAALASVPELNPDNQPTKLYTGTKVGFSTLQTNKEFTYKFLNDVIRELSELTPGPYIHVGGDESHVTKNEDYIPFIERVQEIVLANGKQMIGWDETTLSALKPSTVAQYWSKAENASRGVAKGVKIIMSPAAKAYLDMKYNPKTKLGLHWAGYVEVDTGYKWDPATLVPGITKENILGIECPLWSETVTNIKQIESLVFPRLPGYAEIGWTEATNRKWEEYRVRLGCHAERFKAMDVNYYPSAKVPWK
ncbi:MAG: beta-N-acetylhexosaminidase [Prolixibacteraceae bacterium]|jgi:hexosaminidase|nr:beta-N-acetylhexosaminidase [Prolixibacteraceae bacterium]